MTKREKWSNYKAKTKARGEKEMKKKKKGKGIIIVIIILALVAGGYFVYDNILNQRMAEAEDVEVKEVGSVPMKWEMLSDDDDIKVLDIIDKNDAAYYKIENNKDKATITQINKNDFDAIGSITSNKAYSLIKSGVKSFLNTEYDKLPSNLYEITQTNNSTLFGKMYCNSIKDDLKECFGMNIEKFFNTYKLKISCNDIQVAKMAVYDTEQTSTITGVGSDPMETEWIDYYFVINAKVKTEQAKDGVSKASCFAEEGEIKDLKVLIGGSSDNWFKDLTIDSIVIR